MSGGAELLRLELPGSGQTLVVCLLPEEPEGRIATRAAGVVELAASLEWSPDEAVESSVLESSVLAPLSGLRSSLSFSAGDGVATVRGELSGFEEERLRAAAEESLRALAGLAATREAALRARVLRERRAWFASAEAVQPLARLMWSAGMRVEFGGSWSPVFAEADVAVGCGGDQNGCAETLKEIQAKRRVARLCAAG